MPERHFQAYPLRLQSGEATRNTLRPADIFLEVSSDYIFALNPDGTKLWQFHVSDVQGTKSDSETVYVATSEGVLHAIEKTQGTLLWSIKLGASFLTSPKVSNDSVALFVQGSSPVDRYEVKVDKVTGEVLPLPTLESKVSKQER